MAELAKLTIRVRSNRTGTSVQFTSTGRYKSLQTAGYQRDLTGLPLQPNETIEAFWLAALANVTNSITADPTPP
jgi:hypothetical protein